jgi:hypothetical protein
MREIQFVSLAPTGTVRIALIGESAMQGFPQPLPLTNGAFLEAMLQDVWGQEHAVEVLNFGATAVASFPIRCYIEEILESARPALVILMVGNNEYYGAYGVATVPAVAASPAGMSVLHSLRGLGCVQALSRTAERMRPTGKTLMERAAGAAGHPGTAPRGRGKPWDASSGWCGMCRQACLRSSAPCRRTNGTLPMARA